MAQKVIDIDELPGAVRYDIAANLVERVPELERLGETAETLLPSLAGLVESVPVLVTDRPIAAYEAQVARRPMSAAAVAKLGALQEQLQGEDRDLDPVLVAGGTFIDGRHRFEVWRQMGRETFPAVDISNLMALDWVPWLEGDENVRVPVPSPGGFDEAPGVVPGGS